MLKRKITDTLHLNDINKKFKQNTMPILAPITIQLPSNNTKKHYKYKYNKNNKNANANANANVNANTNINSNIIGVSPLIKSLSPVSLHVNNKKEQIPKRIREMVWTMHNNEKYSNKCYVSWCDNIINVFNYQVGHDIPESKGGTLDLSNLKPICSNCNLSMGNKYTITEWNTLVATSLPLPNKKTNTKPILKPVLPMVPFPVQLPVPLSIYTQKVSMIAILILILHIAIG